MKKSELYKSAQIAVLNSMSICAVDKLEILKELMSQESLAKFCEEQEKEEKKDGN